MSDKQAFTVTSGYGHNTRRPFVEIHGPERKQMSPKEARDLGLNLIQAEAAESDGFLVEFVLEQIEGEMEEAAGLLQMFREWREALWKEKYGG
jgi:hypothetical protein